MSPPFGQGRLVHSMSKVAFVFPGQGSQAVGMGVDLARNFPVARHVFEEVDDALGQKLSALMADGPSDTLTMTENAQPALMAVSLAALRVLIAETGREIAALAQMVAGHSLGEFSALAGVDALPVSVTARLLRRRGQAMQRAVPPGAGAMAALLGAEPAQAQALADEAAQGAVLDVANDNGGGQTVLSGDAAAVDRAVALAGTHGIKKAVRLPVSAPFHCRLMAPAAREMEEALAEISFAAPKVALYANITAAASRDPDLIRQQLIDQVTGRVRWRESVAAMAADGASLFIELGSGKVLTGLLKRIARSATGIAFNGPGDLDGVIAALNRPQEG